MATSQDDRFSHKLPDYVSPTQDNFGVLIPPKRDNRPALPLAEQKRNQKVHELLIQAKAASAQLVEDVKEIQEKRKTLQTAKAKPSKIRYCPAHVLSDMEFVRITRTMNIHDKGAMQLLLANGGNQFLEQGLLPAQAFDLLRKLKMNKMVKKPNHTFDRRPASVRGKVFVPGLPTVDERMAKVGFRVIDGDKK